MKPQCETPAECLRELARVMEQFGINNPVDAVNSLYVKSLYARMFDFVPTFNSPSAWQFAIAEVEGKPVFIGDELYTDSGTKFIAGEMNDGFLCVLGYKERGSGLSILPKWCSWNPPKPKTVMVELLQDDAESLASNRRYEHMEIRIKEACKLALEKLK